ncbi:acyl-CoA dehydrogenase family protein [Tautonia plasticadhaerens]|uniref:acyl-CoA dehydrogenase family protein n=1 Tax=Tautonia plasticadhaerens TaxID=2527974 RepID=UPI0011A5B05C|nr:acyl-CoA dehydrogenase family protein [Tautonia plasticadhaerens]
MSHPDPLALLDDPDLGDLVPRLQALDGPADDSGDWPGPLWSALAGAGVPRWPVPPAFGGEGLDLASLVRREAALAEGSLTAAFIFSQFNAATRRLVAAAEAGHEGASGWLGRVADGRAFPTIGTSQLTTSRRRGTRALAAEPSPGGGYRLDGAMPWVTAAGRADVFVAGAVLEDGGQILVALPADRPGLAVGPPMPLAALQASCTAEVTCDGVAVGPKDVLFGPDPDVLSLASGGAGAGGLETSALAVGQARAALRALRALAPHRDDLDEPIEALESAWGEVASGLLAAAEGRADAPSASEIRTRANPFVIRATHAYLTARKGTGFLRTDPAQRWARQAMFFLVWSCPGPVARAAMFEFAGICPG